MKSFCKRGVPSQVQSPCVNLCFLGMVIRMDFICRTLFFSFSSPGCIFFCLSAHLGIKQKICEQLWKDRPQVIGNIYGRIVWRKCRCDEFRHRYQDWIQQSNQEVKARKLIEDFLVARRAATEATGKKSGRKHKKSSKNIKTTENSGHPETEENETQEELTEEEHQNKKKKDQPAEKKRTIAPKLDLPPLTGQEQQQLSILLGTTTPTTNLSTPKKIKRSKKPPEITPTAVPVSADVPKSLPPTETTTKNLKKKSRKQTTKQTTPSSQEWKTQSGCIWSERASSDGEEVERREVRVVMLDEDSSCLAFCLSLSAFLSSLSLLHLVSFSLFLLWHQNRFTSLDWDGPSEIGDSNRRYIYGIFWVCVFFVLFCFLTLWMEQRTGGMSFSTKQIVVVADQRSWRLVINDLFFLANFSFSESIRGFSVFLLFSFFDVYYLPMRIESAAPHREIQK